MKTNIWVILIFAFLLSNCSVPTKKSESPVPLILISIDGLRPDYLSKTDTPNFDYLIENGVLAKHMIPVFPSKTFPNHYSLVTGLYTENTGIIANNMFDKTIDLDLVDVIDLNPVAMMEPKDFANRNAIYEKLKSSESNYTVFMKRDIPSLYRIANNPRTPEILMIADVGYTITTSENFESREISGGAHGYDHREPEMRSFFLGYGPKLKQNAVVEPFQVIHVYELMTNLLQLTPVKNNGSLDSIRTVLR